MPRPLSPTSKHLINTTSPGKAQPATQHQTLPAPESQSSIPQSAKTKHLTKANQTHQRTNQALSTKNGHDPHPTTRQLPPNNIGPVSLQYIHPNQDGATNSCPATLVSFFCLIFVHNFCLWKLFWVFWHQWLYHPITSVKLRHKILLHTSEWFG